MILEETLNKLIRDTINLIMGIPDFAIKSKQLSAPRPIGAYADVDLSTRKALGWEEFNSTDQDLTDDIDIMSEGLREISISVGFYRDGAVDNGTKVHQGLVRESIQAIFKQAGVGLIGRSDVLEISESFTNGWEERSQLDITMSAVGTDVDIVKSIATVDIAGEFQSRGLTYNFNIEV